LRLEIRNGTITSAEILVVIEMTGNVARLLASSIERRKEESSFAHRERDSALTARYGDLAIRFAMFAYGMHRQQVPGECLRMHWHWSDEVDDACASVHVRIGTETERERERERERGGGGGGRERERRQIRGICHSVTRRTRETSNVREKSDRISRRSARALRAD